MAKYPEVNRFWLEVLSGPTVSPFEPAASDDANRSRQEFPLGIKSGITDG